MTDLTIRMNVDCFVLSLAEGDLADLKPVFQKDREGVPGYLSVVEIAKIDAFLHALPSAIVKGGGPEIDGSKVSDLFEPPQIQKVRYGSPEKDFATTTTPADADPFLKRKMYESQSELRIVLHPLRPPISLDRVIIQVGVPKGTFIEIEKTPQPDSNGIEQRDLVAAVAELAYWISSWIEPQPSDQAVYDGKITREQYSHLYTEIMKHTEAQFNSRFRLPMLRAYWTLRSGGYPSEILDLEFSKASKHTPIVFELERYLLTLRENGKKLTY